MKTHIILFLALLALFVVPATAGPPEKVPAFVCPVFNNTAVGEHNPNVIPIADGDYTLLPGRAGQGGLMVPVHATNDNGAGSPGGPHLKPGSPGYTPIWNNTNS